MRAIMHAEDAILGCWAERHELGTEGLADPPGPVAEADESVTVDLADLVTWCVFDGGQHVGEAARARPVARGRRRHVERLVRPLVVIARAPSVESPLTISEIAEASSADDFGFERSMETLFLALRLRVARPTVQDADAEPQQPDAESGVRLAARIAPRRAAVHQHRQRHAVAA